MIQIPVLKKGNGIIFIIYYNKLLQIGDALTNSGELGVILTQLINQKVFNTNLVSK